MKETAFFICCMHIQYLVVPGTHFGSFVPISSLTHSPLAEHRYIAWKTREGKEFHKDTVKINTGQTALLYMIHRPTYFQSKHSLVDIAVISLPRYFHAFLAEVSFNRFLESFTFPPELCVTCDKNLHGSLTRQTERGLLMNLRSMAQALLECIKHRGNIKLLPTTPHQSWPDGTKPQPPALLGPLTQGIWLCSRGNAHHALCFPGCSRVPHTHSGQQLCTEAPGVRRCMRLGHCQH